MILRYIIFIFIGFLLYRLIKKLLTYPVQEKRIYEEASEMVLDEHCGRYILKRNALKLRKNGDDVFFCSEECIEGFERRGRK